MCVEARQELAGVASLLPPCLSWGLNSKEMLVAVTVLHQCLHPGEALGHRHLMGLSGDGACYVGCSPSAEDTLNFGFALAVTDPPLSPLPSLPPSRFAPLVAVWVSGYVKTF